MPFLISTFSSFKNKTVISREYNVGVKEELEKTEVPIELLLLAMMELGIFQVCYFGPELLW